LCFFGVLVVVTHQQPIRPYDVIVYGSTPAGIAAAITAANGGKLRVALLEPTSYLGGMSVAGGIGFRDIADLSTFGGIGIQWANINAKYYNVTYPVLQPDMYVGEASWKTLLAAEKTIEVFYNTALNETNPLKKSGTTIISITTGVSKIVQVWAASVFIDASYEGDLTRFSKASYTYGRESSQQYGEVLAGVQTPYTPDGNFLKTYPVNATYDNGTLIPFVLPGPLKPKGSADDKSQAYSYRLCITTNTANQAPFPKPDNYNPDDFVMLQRYIDSLVKSGKFPEGPSLGYLVDILDYRNYPLHNKWDLCDSATAAFTSDVVNLNDGYVTANYAERKKIAQKHYYYEAGMLYYLLNDPRVPEATRASVKKYGLCKDQWPENQHWPPQIYIRQALRLVGSKVYTEKDVVNAKCINDSIAVGSWVIDIHVVQRVAVLDTDGKTLVVDNEGQMVRSIGKPYQISYSILVPKPTEVTNLIVPVCNSASHVAYGSIRVEPTYVQLGQASGVAAAIAVRDKVPVQNVSITELQATLLAQGVHINTTDCK